MNPFALSAHIAACLDEHRLDYAIGGALALTAHAIVRNTNDIDLSVFVPVPELQRVFDTRAGENGPVRGDDVRAVFEAGTVARFTQRMYCH